MSSLGKIVICPLCGTKHRIKISKSGWYAVICRDHSIVIYADNHLNIREIKTALLIKSSH